MADTPSNEQKEQITEEPAPEVLKPRAESVTNTPQANQAIKPSAGSGLGARLRRPSYHPSHKATFIGLVVVILILAINAAVIAFIVKHQSKSNASLNQDQVTISQGVLDKLGVNRSSVGDVGTQLTVGPNAKFNGTVTVGSDVSIAGQLKLNSKFSANDASLAQLEAGKTALSSLDVNGDSTVSNLNLRNDLLVTGISRLQGPVTMSQLLTVNNNVNISGSLSVGGSLSVNNFHASTLVLDSSLTVGGHVITRGSAPGVGRGGAVGSNGSVSISGNDASGTVAINVGAGATGGTLVNVAFRNQYGTTPHVVVSPVGGSAGSFYVSRSIGGFSIGVASGLAPGGYAFDYIVEQ